jgi:hypothetical protein
VHLWAHSAPFYYVVSHSDIVNDRIPFAIEERQLVSVVDHDKGRRI